MTHKMTPGEFLSKAEWEGGLEEAILGYGLTEDDLDKDSAPDLWEAVKNFREVAAPAAHRLYVVADRYPMASADDA